MDDYVGHLREFRRILRNLESQATHPLNRETIVALTKKLDRDESQLNADRLERSIRATVEATRSIEDLDHYEQDVLAVFQEITSRKRRELERERLRQDPTRPEPYQALLELYSNTGHLDAAWCVSQALVLIECPRMLFPFARQIICDATRNGGFPPLMIDPVDFARLYQERMLNQSPPPAQA